MILMGKNTLMKRCIRLYCENNKDDSWNAIVPDLVGNVGVLFVKDNFKAAQDLISEFKRPAGARVGANAQVCTPHASPSRRIKASTASRAAAPPPAIGLQ